MVEITKIICSDRRLDTVLLVLYALASWFTITSVFGNQGFGDSDKYIAIAQSPFMFTESPWGYRLLVPWAAAGLSSLFDVSLESTFYTIQLLSYLLCLALIHHVASTLESSRSVKVLCLLIFSLGYQFVYYRHNYIHVGMMELFFLGCLVWLLYVEKWMLILLVLSISIFVKESVAFVFLQTIVVYWLIELVIFKQPTLKFKQLLLICTIPLLFFIGIRLLFGSTDVASSESYLAVYDQQFFAKIFNGDFSGRLIDYFTVYGALLFLIPIALWFWRQDKFIRINLLVILFSASQLLLATDSKRMACMGVISLIYILISLSKILSEARGIIILGFLQLIYAAGWLSQTYWVSALALLMSVIVLYLSYSAGHFALKSNQLEVEQ